MHALGRPTCDSFDLGVSGSCDFPTYCLTPPKQDCSTGNPTCCSGSLKAGYARSITVAALPFGLGPVSCEAKLDFNVGGTIDLKREWGGMCSCDEGTFQATGNVVARDVGGFDGCSVTLFGYSKTFEPAEITAGACVSLGLAGKEGCGEMIAPVGSSGVKFGIKVNYKIGFLEFAPWELTSGGGVDVAGNLTTDVTCF